MTELSNAVLSPAGAATLSPAASPAAVYEQAVTLAAMGLYKPATRAFRDVTVRAPDHAPAWQRLAALLRLAGRDEEASGATARADGLISQWPPAKDGRTPAEIEAAEHVLGEQLAKFPTPPEQLQVLQNHLREHETDVAAMRLLARIERDRGNLFVARDLFERALDLVPSYANARADLVPVLRFMRRDAHAVAETKRLVARAPDNINYRVMHADALEGIGDVGAAIPILEQLVRENPTRARLRCIYARALRIAGRSEDSAREYRVALELRPGLGEAYGGLAELRGSFLTNDDIAAMREHLRDNVQDEDSRMRIQFALGRALEQIGDFAGSFAAYEAGNALARIADFDMDDEVRDIRRRSAVFTERTVARSAAPGASSPTPIFIVGMPRAGSTLVEQILASHSNVEGTMELPVIGNILRDLSRSRLLVTLEAYPECVAQLAVDQLSELGARYIRDAAAYRRTDLPYFVDKRPWNWLEAGFIRMILPHAKIVDVRRQPIAACFGMYKQNMGEATFSNDFNDLAQYYTEYVSMMRHWDTVMPGRVHLVHYKRLVENTEAEIRSLLEYCGLPFEEGCLRFWETRRTVSTPSAEQVRRPIFRSGLDQWHNFETWLDPLKQALETTSAGAAPPQPEGYDLALTCAAMGVYERALKELQAVTKSVPTHPGAWKKLAELLHFAGKDKAADDAEAKARLYASEFTNWRPSRDLRTPQQLDAGKRALETSLTGMDRTRRMASLRKHLAEYPTDAGAMYLLSELESLDCDEFTSIALLERTLELSPGFHAARHDLVSKLVNQREFARALEQAAMLVRDAPDIAGHSALRAEVLEISGKVSEAMAIMEELLRQHPRRPAFWLRYGMLLRTAGKREQSARAFRTCLELSPKAGEAYAALADLKGSFLTDADIGAMRGFLADPSLEPVHRMRMHYALGHTLERAGDFSASFASYQSAARLIRGAFLGRGEAYDEKETVERVRRFKRFFTARTLSRSPRTSTPTAVTPIFVVGLPRAGSTLVEQILASHSEVEGTRELPLIAEIVRDLVLARRIRSGNAYPDCLRDMTTAQLVALGERYIERAREFRQTDRRCFVDKRPWNWLDAALIHLILPQAKIIDIRREPMAACFAMFKQQLPRDAAFSYDLGDLGGYYNIYVSLMEHWKSVMPGRIHFVQYERLVKDSESEIRRMLDYCGLPFEDACLRFWETDRAVLTPSAEQVRRPIYRDAVEQWRNFEPWLGALKEALAEPAKA